MILFDKEISLEKGDTVYVCCSDELLVKNNVNPEQYDKHFTGERKVFTHTATKAGKLHVLISFE